MSFHQSRSYFNIVTDIRLHNGTVPSEGRVELYINGRWGSICANEAWDYDRASFFCRLLDYDSAASVLRDTIFGEGSGPVMVDQLECRDYKMSSFDHCTKVFFPKDCKKPGASVRCLKKPYDGKYLCLHVFMSRVVVSLCLCVSVSVCLCFWTKSSFRNTDQCKN